MKIQRFEDIIAWQKARELVEKIYRLTGTDKFNRDFGLKDQIRRAAISVMSNIAESYARQTDKEFVQFLYIARGSAFETQSQLYLHWIWDIYLKRNLKRLTKPFRRSLGSSWA